jgi:leucyl aminopeptidase
MSAKNGPLLEFVAAGKSAAEVLLVALPTKPRPPLPLLARLDELTDDAVSQMVELGALNDELASVAHTTSRDTYRRVIRVALGDAAELNAAKLRQAAAAAMRWVQSARVSGVTLWLDGLLASKCEQPAAEWAAAMVHAAFRFSELRKPDEKSAARVRIGLASSEPAHVTRCLAEIKPAVEVAAAANYARTIAHRPPNLLNPSTLADEARALARQYKLKITIINAQQAAKLRMNGLLSVGMAAEHKPCMIRLDYDGWRGGRVTHAVVGKAITFDTGGICIKPAAGMESMKFDKCGGMAVLGVMRAVAALKLRCNVVGILAAAENAISDEAYRPSDIITMMSGKTVEVTNTDAEGRMVLADALWYVQRECKPATVVNLATLTGGVVTALGKHAAGLMSNDQALSDELVECGERVHERVWPLPLWDDYRELIKGSDSDIKNSSGKRYAHPIVGGMFLKEFIQPGTRWAHLDIAGTATTEDEKIATGFGVRLMVEYLRRKAGRA